MKRLLFFICTLLCANVLMAQTTFWIGDLQYEVTSTNPAEVKVNDANLFITTANIPTTVSYEGTNYSVTSIGDNAFWNCSSLTSIDIPNSVTSIGDNAFWNCSSLTSITIPNSVTSIGDWAFYSCDSLTSIDIPNSVTSIGDWTFTYCSSLTSIDIPNSVTSIGYLAFAFCSGLTSIDIPNSVTSIGNSAFKNCDSLTSVTIGNSVTSIEYYAFGNCSSLTSVTCLAETVPSLGASVFASTPSTKTLTVTCESDYSAWESATTWASVERIGCEEEECVDVFTIGDLTYEKTSATEVSVKDCSETATEVIIPASVEQCGITYSVTSIGNDAFNNCRSLTSVTIGNSVTSIGLQAFYWCSSLTSVTIPNSVTSIGNSAFMNCLSLTSVTIPNSVTSIGDYAFMNCLSLTSVTIPNSVTSIGRSAFNSCSSLTSVTIPNSVTSIGNNAFRYCSSLTSVTCLAETAPSLGNDVFSSTPSTKTLTYPCGATGYSTNWGNTTWASVNEDCPTLEIGEQFTIGDFTYEVTSANEVAVKTYNNNTATSTEIPSTVTYQGTTYSVTFIKGKAFYNKYNLTSVTIPNSVTAIGTSSDFYGAFESCDGLTSISIPNSVTSIGDYAFLFCSSLTSVTIPNSVTDIGWGTFYYCISLTSIDIPNSVTSIRSNAFKNCISLTSVTLPNNANISSNAFENTGGINVDGIYYGGKETVNIGNYTFNNVGFITFYLDGNATTITPSEVSVIDCDESLSGDIVISSILSYEGINYSVTSIGNDAFENCDGLTSVTIPNSVTSIGGDAFYNCISLTSVTIPNSVTSIGTWAFYNCSSLTSVTCLAETAPSLGASVFSYTPSTKTLTYPCESDYSAWESATTWASVECIDIYVYLGNSLTYFPLTFEIISEEERTMKVSDCDESTTDVEIPARVMYNEELYDVTSIGNSAFSGCSGLDSITCLAETAPSLGVDVFLGTPSTKTLTVPFGSNYSSWQSATTWAKTNYLIQEGETKILETDFTINASTSLINNGVLRIKQNGQLINETSTNVSGVFEIETPTLANDKWSFVGAPFNGYKLEAIKEGTRDVAVSVFDYGSADWSEEFATIETPIRKGEGFLLWSFAEEATVFTTNPENPSEEYTLNNGGVSVTETLTTHEGGGNWMALANPYTFKLDIAKFLQDQNDVKGGIVYRLNGVSWEEVSSGVIGLTEGFFVNYANPGSQTATFVRSHRYTGSSSKAEKKKEYIKLYMNDGERTSKLSIAQNEEASQGDDIFDANKLFSPFEIAEPYFLTEGVALVKEEVKTLPYTATLNVKSYESKEVTFSVGDIPEDYNVYLIDNGFDIKMNDGVEYNTRIVAGENADRFKFVIKKAHRLTETVNKDIYVNNFNREVRISSTQKDLKIEVYDALGRKVFETKDYKFELNQVPAGAYMVKVYNRFARKDAKIVLH